MGAKRQLEFYLLRYVPNIVRGEFVNVGLIMMEADAEGFAEVRFTQDWRAAERFDPQIDIEMLQATERHIRENVQDPGRRMPFLRKMEDSFSNLIQLSPKSIYSTEEPAKEIEALASFYFKAVHPESQRAPSARSRIWQQMRAAFEGEGILDSLLTDISMEKYTMPGDPLKLDFGYNTEANLKFLQAVSLKANLTQATNLAARFPKIADKIADETKIVALLTAVVDDDLDRSNSELAFALNFMTENHVQVVVAADMPKIAERARVEMGL
jgi:hypothetical protein